jgi:ribosome biogenesis GTPase A
LDAEKKLDGYSVISAIARKRGYLLKGGKPDLEKAGRALMQDYSQRSPRPHQPGDT